MRTYTIAPDDQREPTLWCYPSWDAVPVAIARRCDTPTLLWRMAQTLVDPGQLGEALRQHLRETATL